MGQGTSCHFWTSRFVLPCTYAQLNQNQHKLKEYSYKLVPFPMARLEKSLFIMYFLGGRNQEKGIEGVSLFDIIHDAQNDRNALHVIPQ